MFSIARTMSCSSCSVNVRCSFFDIRIRAEYRILHFTAIVFYMEAASDKRLSIAVLRVFSY